MYKFKKSVINTKQGKIEGKQSIKDQIYVRNFFQTLLGKPNRNKKSIKFRWK